MTLIHKNDSGDMIELFFDADKPSAGTQIETIHSAHYVRRYALAFTAKSGGVCCSVNIDVDGGSVTVMTTPTSTFFNVNHPQPFAAVE
jgi:hypothetical protein